MTTAPRWATILRWALALPVLALALLPVDGWLGTRVDPSLYATAVDEWWSGTLIAVGLGVVLALLSRRIPRLWRDGAWGRTADRTGLVGPPRAALVAVVAGLVYAVIAKWILSGRPLLIDEIAQVWQARVYASGRLSVPSTGHPEFFGVANLVDHGGRVFSQFPAGGPAMLALGSLLHAEWLVGPVAAALGVWWWAAVLRRTGEPQPSATNALLLLAFAPFAMFMSGSHMNHVTTLTWVLGGMAGLALVTTSERPRPLAALGLGLAFGVAATIRPLDAFAFGFPAGGWLFLRALRDRRRAMECGLAAVGMALPIAALLVVNARTTGDPLTFGYTLLWGRGHELGFHQPPWGPPHTPARGLALLNSYLLHLQVRFLETPWPSLLPALAVLAMGSRLRPFDRYLATGSALLLGGYWAYWFNGYYLGPRFVYLLVPFAALLTARCGTMIRERLGGGSLGHRIWIFSAGTGAVLALGLNIPLRAKQYANAFQTPRYPVAEAAAAAGARNALVLVRESWGAQLVVRMWGLGVPASTEEFVYWRTDMCAMTETVRALERAGLRDSAAAAALMALTADSSRVVDAVLSIDKTERVLPGSGYTPYCRARLAEDARGFTLYAPLILEDRTGNIYVHDQHERDTLMLARYPDRPVFLYAPADTMQGTAPRFVPVRRDSLFADWGLAGAGGR